MKREASTGSSPLVAKLELRAPVARDAADIWRVVDGTAALDGNSPYAYLLLCTHFAATGLVIRSGAELVAFALGYVRPDDPATAFLWQVGVAERARGRGLGGLLLDAWFARCADGLGAHFLEATLTPSNGASRALFSSFALRHGARMREHVAFPEELFPDGVAHEAEIALRIGPIAALQDPLVSSHRETH